MGQLDPQKHRLASYVKDCNQLVWGKNTNGTHLNGYAFIKDTRAYKGDLITVKTAGSKTRVTPNHRVLVRFSDAFMEKYVVYLMRRGDWWRVGVCVSAHRPYKPAGINGRLGTEQADAGWILGVYSTREEALVEEARVQGLYGIPGMTFEAAKTRSLTSEQLHQIHESVKDAVIPRAMKLLSDFGLDAQEPLYTRAVLGGSIEKRNLRSAFTTSARNLLSGYMEFPVVSDAFVSCAGTRENWVKPEWHVVSVTRSPYEGEVHSLTVLPHRYYVSGGAIVHNSVKGAQWNHVALCMSHGFFPGIRKDEADDLSGELQRLGLADPRDPAKHAEAAARLQSLDEDPMTADRNLAYVGVTRAKEDLTIVCSQERVPPKLAEGGPRLGKFVYEAGWHIGENVAPTASATVAEAPLAVEPAPTVVTPVPQTDIEPNQLSEPEVNIEDVHLAGAVDDERALEFVDVVLAAAEWAEDT